MLFDEMKNYGSRTLAVDDSGRKISYAEAEAEAAEFRRAVGERRLIFILCENTLGSLIGYLSCMRTGVVPLLLSSTMPAELLQELVEKYRPSYLYVPESSLDRAAGCEVVRRRFGFCLCRRREDSPPRLHEDLALLLTTSGSTGSPHLVRQSVKNIDSNANSIAEYLEIDEKERPITTLPMNYTYGLSIINSHVIRGATLLFTTYGILERPFWEFLKRGRGTSFGGVPYTYQILKRIGFMEMELPDLKTLTQAGGKLQDALNREFSEYAVKTGKRFIVMYGQTEASPRMSYLPPSLALEKCGSIGIAIPGGRFHLEDEAAREILEADTEGELIYEGANVAMGYARCAEDLVKPDEWQGVLRTGDMARRDADGFYYITGRKKRFIKLFGNRVSLDEMEALLKKKFSGVDFACAGDDDGLLAYTDEAGRGREEEIALYVSDLTGFPLRVITAVSLDRIPRSESGKVIYGRLPARGAKPGCEE